MPSLNEKNLQLLFCGLVFLLCYIFLIILAQRPPYAFDSYWHLQMGKDLLENGASPWIDHYSFTFQGEEISTVPVLFQVILATLVSLFGDKGGFDSFKLFYITALMLSVFLYFKQIKASWFIVFLLLPFITYFVNIRLIVRPDVLSNILIVVCLSLYLRARASFTTRELAYISVLLLFWVNYHSPVFGYIIVFGLFIDKAVHKLFKGDDSFNWQFWFIWGVVIVLIGFLNPQGHHFLITNYALLFDDFSKYTSEYMPSYQSYSTDKIVYLLWIVSLYISIWSLVKKQYGFAFISFLLTYFSWSTARLVTPVAITNFCILAFYLSQLSRDKLSTLKPVIRKSVIYFSILLSLLGYYTVIKTVLTDYENRKNKPKYINARFPVKVVDYLKNYHSGGNILNLLSDGGYIIYKLSPDFKVYIDGRTNILYPAEFLEYWIHVYSDPKILQAEIADKNINYAIYDNTPDNLLRFKEIDKLQLNYADENHLLFSERKKTAFPLSSKLVVFPMCWNDRLAPQLQREMILAEKIFTNKSYDIKWLLAFMDDYLSQGDKQRFLDKLNPNTLKVNSNRRLGAYISLKNQSHNTALLFFSAISSKNEYDYLMMAYSMVQQKQYDNAERMLYYLYTFHNFNNTRDISFEKLFIFTRLLGTIQDNGKTRFFSPAYKKKLEKQLQKIDSKSNDPRTAIKLFSYACNSLF